MTERCLVRVERVVTYSLASWGLRRLPPLSGGPHGTNRRVSAPRTSKDDVSVSQGFSSRFRDPTEKRLDSLLGPFASTEEERKQSITYPHEILSRYHCESHR